MTVRMKDIAKKAGVSTVTVSKALSGQRGVSEQMRSEIIRLAGEMGYVNHAAAARKERSRISYTIGILMANRFFDRYNSFYGNLLQLVSAEASVMECSTMLEIVSDEMERNGTVPRMLREETVDGVIVLGSMEEEYLKVLREREVPLMYLDFTSREERCDCVISDSFYGASQMTDYLFRRGHRRIAYVGTVLSTTSITDRYLGYLKSMMEHQVQPLKEWIIDDRDPETGMMDTDRFFRLPDPLPSAFVCNCDLAAAYLLKKLEEQGLTCPDDVSVAGFDNFAYPGISEHQFTTYEVDVKEMARKAVHNLLHKLNGEYYRRGVVIVTGRLVERETVKTIDERHF